MHKVYYDKAKNFTIIDVSGVKPIELIKEEFGDCDYQVVEINPMTESYDIVDGIIKKISI